MLMYVCLFLSSLPYTLIGNIYKHTCYFKLAFDIYKAIKYYSYK